MVFNSIPGSRLPPPSWQLEAGSRGHGASRGACRDVPARGQVCCASVLCCRSPATAATPRWNSPASRVLMLHRRQEGRRGAGLTPGVSDLSADGLSAPGPSREPQHTSLFPAPVLPILQPLHVPNYRNRGCSWKISGATAAVQRYNSTNTPIITFNVVFHQRKESRTWIP